MAHFWKSDAATIQGQLLSGLAITQGDSSQGRLLLRTAITPRAATVMEHTKMWPFNILIETCLPSFQFIHWLYDTIIQGYHGHDACKN